jgi:ribosome-binding protein aMBF1 (putative translation factor)
MTFITTQDASGQYNSAFMLALAVLKEKVGQLPQEDQNDLLEATKAFVMAETDEDRRSAELAMNEIMDQKPHKVIKPALDENKGALESWLAFVSQRIREHRVAKGWTQEDLANASGLTQSHVCRLERGDHSPNEKTRKKIADALGIPLADLDPSAD